MSLPIVVWPSPNQVAGAYARYARCKAAKCGDHARRARRALVSRLQQVWPTAAPLSDSPVHFARTNIKQTWCVFVSRHEGCRAARLLSTFPSDVLTSKPVLPNAVWPTAAKRQPRAPLSSLRLSRSCCKQVEPGGTRQGQHDH